MDDWEDEDIVIPPSAPGEWDDEDAESDVADSWDQPEPTAENAVPQPPKPKKKLKDKIAERNQKIAEKAAALVDNESPQERKARLVAQEKESDLKNAQDLFSGLDVSDQIPEKFIGNTLDTMIPSTSAEFDEFRNLLSNKFTLLESKSHYVNFIELLLRDAVVSFSVEDLRKLTATLNAMMNEKQKAAKDTKKKKNTKKMVKMTSNGVDTTNYDDVYDDFDDFM